jgi:hypothetical protein
MCSNSSGLVCASAAVAVHAYLLVNECAISSLHLFYSLCTATTFTNMQKMVDLEWTSSHGSSD